MNDILRDQLQAALGAGYNIERELGGGGMSRVFVAVEKSLGREIVVKVVPSDAASAVSVERFKREIQVAARLQHPHIVPVLSAGEAGGVPFYTMPLVRGESLRARLTKGGEFSVNETTHILRDIASALAYAHGEGIVHRDIKPENVMLSGGVAVVTDFGVAKAMNLAAADDGGHSSGLTSRGIALGTPAYMAPEQATAEPHVDHRADIYSFGCLAYELLAGSSPFAGRPLPQLLVAHVTESPDSIAKRRAAVPPGLAVLVMRCLEKSPGDRPQSANELIAALDAIGTPSGGTAPTERARRSRAKWYVLGASATAALTLAYMNWSRTSSIAAVSVGKTTQVAVGPELEREPAISPDGKLVAYAAQTPAGHRIFVRQVDGGDRANPLTTDLDGDHRWPRWSPNQARISFVAKGAIYVAPALGGTPTRLVDTAETGEVATHAFGSHAWSPDGNQIAYAQGGQIWVRAVAGGKPRSIAVGARLHSPSWSPNMARIAYSDGIPPAMNNITTNAVWTVAVKGGSSSRFSDSIHVNVNPTWAADGNSIFFISSIGGARDIYQQAVGADGTPRGKSERITTGLGSFTFTLSADGSRLAYDVVRPFANIWVVPINQGAVSSTEASRPVTTANQHIEGMDVSHDGKWLAYDSDWSGSSKIYKLRIDGGNPVPLTTGAGNDFMAKWSPDDREIAFHSLRNGARDIFVVAAEGGAERQITSSPHGEWNPFWWPDGQRLVFSFDSADRFVPYVVHREGDGRWSAQRPLGTVDAVKRCFFCVPGKSGVATSRDGALALVGLDGRASRILADSASLGGAVSFMQWSRDGATIYTRAGRAIWAVPIAGGVPRRVLEESPAHRFARPQFATDGTRLFFVKAAYESDVWVMDLRR